MNTLSSYKSTPFLTRASVFLVSMFIIGIIIVASIEEASARGRGGGGGGRSGGHSRGGGHSRSGGGSSSRSRSGSGNLRYSGNRSSFGGGNRSGNRSSFGGANKSGNRSSFGGANTGQRDVRQSQRNENRGDRQDQINQMRIGNSIKTRIGMKDGSMQMTGGMSDMNTLKTIIIEADIMALDTDTVVLWL